MTIRGHDEVIKVLHFDDNPYELEAVERVLLDQSFGPKFQVQSCTNVEDVKRRLASKEVPHLVLLDLFDENKNSEVGFDLIKKVQGIHPNAVIVMRSSSIDPLSVVKSLQLGADDFISKRTEKAELSLRLSHALHLARLKRGILETTLGVQHSANDATSWGGETMRKIAMRIPKLIDSAVAAVHIYGEPGTGKEVVANLFAAALHKGTPFVRVHCGAIAPALLESELFGVVKGAYTGATSDRPGLMEEAHGGWLFLDEIATLPSAAQVAMLRVLENHEIRPVGGSKTKKINIRVISATNERLSDLVSAGKFRKDLWQRLIETTLELPPLRERRDEIETLALSLCKTMEGGPYRITSSAISVLTSLSWSQGNVRELRNCLRAMTELCEDKILTPLSIPSRYCRVEDTNTLVALQDNLPPTPANERDVEGIFVRWDSKSPSSFEECADVLLKEMIGKLAHDNGRLTLRALAKQTGIAKTTLSKRLRKMVAKKILTADELKQMVGLDLEHSTEEDA